LKETQTAALSAGDVVKQRAQTVLAGERSFDLIVGDSKDVLSHFPDECIDCVITSPPYWKLRDYEIGATQPGLLIGDEDKPEDYVKNLVEVFNQVRRVLKPTGSLWLNIGDKYVNKNLMGMPWRVALALQDAGWILRNDIIWEKMKGSQPVNDRFRNNHEYFFYFVKRQEYYFDVTKILVKPTLKPTISDNGTISATGVSGKKYRRQILGSDRLNEKEREAALKALDEVLQQIRDGEVVDFRMTIRGEQRTYHSNSHRVSGRAKELEQRGFFILKSYAKGYVPSDVWQIAPEDTVKDRSEVHYAVFPVELLEKPIRATCPANGVILDPFVGVGSTIVAALYYGHRGVGIDISPKYIEIARERVMSQNKGLGLL
jgi:DNA modification methylase